MVLTFEHGVLTRLAPGDPLDSATKLGAIVDDIQLKRVLGYIDVGRKDGANVFLGGRRVREDSGGYFVEPTVFDGVSAQHDDCSRGDLWAVLSTITFKTVEEAIEIANDVIYWPRGCCVDPRCHGRSPYGKGAACRYGVHQLLRCDDI